MERRASGAPTTPTSPASPDGTRFYFVHSYAPDVTTDTTVGATSTAAFAAVVAQDNVFATQFHPEKSGDAGLHVYERS